jgi:hypothetical protein
VTGWDCEQNGHVFAGPSACGYCGHPPKVDPAALCGCALCTARAAVAAAKAAAAKRRVP